MSCEDAIIEKSDCPNTNRTGIIPEIQNLVNSNNTQMGLPNHKMAYYASNLTQQFIVFESFHCDSAGVRKTPESSIRIILTCDGSTECFYYNQYKEKKCDTLFRSLTFDKLILDSVFVE